MEKWRQMKHPNVVSLREAFTTKAFNDNCAFSPPIPILPPRHRPPSGRHVTDNSLDDGVRFPPKLHHSRRRTPKPRNDGHDPSSEITPADSRTVTMELYHSNSKRYQSHPLFRNGIERIRSQSDNPYRKEQVSHYLYGLGGC